MNCWVFRRDSISKYPIKRIFNARPKPRDLSKTLLFVDKATVYRDNCLSSHFIAKPASSVRFLLNPINLLDVFWKQPNYYILLNIRIGVVLSQGKNVVF